MGFNHTKLMAIIADKNTAKQGLSQLYILPIYYNTYKICYTGQHGCIQPIRSIDVALIPLLGTAFPKSVDDA